MNSSGKGKASKPTVKVVNHAPATDPVRLRATRIEQADAAVVSAEAAVTRLTALLEAVPSGKKARQRDHLKVAKEALAQATAARKELG